MAQQKGFIVLSVLATSYQPTFHSDGKLMFFDSEETAQTEINELIDEVSEEKEKGNMENDVWYDDYTVIPATKDEQGYIRCTVDGLNYIMHETDDDYAIEQ